MESYTKPEIRDYGTLTGTTAINISYSSLVRVTCMHIRLFGLI